MLVMGLGYSGEAIAREASKRGFLVMGTKRNIKDASSGLGAVRFDVAGDLLAESTHLVVTTPPGNQGDPVLATYENVLARAPRLRWIGYVSSTGVYGDRRGGWVDETSRPHPGQFRSQRRRVAEMAWEAVAAGRIALDLFRTGGIYGPGRNTLDDLRAGIARRVFRPGHAFSRIHRDDIALAVVAAALNPPGPGVRVLHLVDDEPAENATVVEEAARLLNIVPPPLLPYEQAIASMSLIARSFWSESRRVANQRTKAALEISWRYPSFREGLRAILAEERQQTLPE